MTMKNKLIRIAIVAVAAMGSSAFAGAVGSSAVQGKYEPLAPAVVATPAPKTVMETPKRFSGDVSLGYTSHYSYRGLSMQNAGDDNVIPLVVNLEYALNDKYSILLGGSYTKMVENGMDYETGVCSEDSATAYLGVRRDWGKGLKTTLGYEWMNGGMLALYHPQRLNTGGLFFNSERGEQHAFNFDVDYDFSELGLKGVFWKSRVTYVAQWEQGFWFTNSLGYKYDLCPRAQAIIYGSWDATAEYFDTGLGLNTNGTQGVSLNLEIPSKVCENVTVTPFVRCLWLGDAGIAANKRNHEQVYRNFTVLGGVSVTYSF